MSARINRRTLTAVLLAASTGAARAAAPVPALRGDDSERLPDHAALFSRLPLPFSPAEAWRLLSPATQAEIGAAVIGMHLAQYVHGDSMAEADAFLDDALRDAVGDAAHDILNRTDDRLWALFPDLYGPNGDHPAWALAAGMVHPLGTVLPEPEPTPTSADPVLAAIEAREAASRHLAQVSAETVGNDSPEAEALWSAGDRSLAAADEALRATAPTTFAGLVALAQHYAATASDPHSDGLTHLVEALAEFEA